MAVAHKSTHKNAVRSRQMIKKAFAEMLNEKDITKITVTDIVEKAGVSRGTFYAHYMDVYDLYTAIQSNMMETVRSAIDLIGPRALILDPTEVIARALAFLNEKKAYYKLFVTTSRSDALVARIKDYVGERLTAEVDETFSEEDRKEVKLFIYYSLGAIEYLVRSWLDDSIPLTAEEVSALIAKTYLKSKPDVLTNLQ
ncbi:MAG: TetR/AcrR family transcriptional regulator C-terminal domain-containing protein [Clostridia bacterium]|nr:TetR/AcrR family transcriptional regulator C-terminal domain-containing protein [Clostridia bacterium]